MANILLIVTRCTPGKSVMIASSFNDTHTEIAIVTKGLAWKMMWILCAAGSVPMVLLTASRSGFLGMCLVGWMLFIGDELPRNLKNIAVTAGALLAIIVFFFVARRFNELARVQEEAQKSALAAMGEEDPTPAADAIVDKTRREGIIDPTKKDDRPNA